MLDTYQTVLSNLLATVDQNVKITIPTFDPTIELCTQVNTAYISMQQSLRQGKWEQALAFTYF
ncbi:40516_t:CDS:1, partial [Gigaspora margarita]